MKEIAPEMPEGQDPVAKAFWQSLMRSIDPGTLASDNGWNYRILMFAVTIGIKETKMVTEPL